MGSQDTLFVEEHPQHRTLRRDDDSFTEKQPLPPPVRLNEGMDEAEIRYQNPEAVHVT